MRSAKRDVLRTLSAVRSATLFGDTLHVRLEVGDAGWAAAAAALEDAGIAVLDVEPATPRLEDVFIDMVSSRDPAAPPAGPRFHN